MLIAAQYPLGDYKNPALALGTLGTDAIFSCPTLLIDQDLARYVPTCAYEFNDENAPSPYPSLGFRSAQRIPSNFRTCSRCQVRRRP